MYVHYHVSIPRVGPVISQPAWAAAKYTFLCSNLLIALVSTASLLMLSAAMFHWLARTVVGLAAERVLLLLYMHSFSLRWGFISVFALMT